MSKPLIALRNKISRQAYEVPADEADQILAHPIWGKINEVVRTAKPEVLKSAEVERSEDEESKDEPEKISPSVFASKADKKKDNA